MFFGYKITLPAGGAVSCEWIIKKKCSELLNQNETECALVTHWLHWCNNAPSCPPSGRMHFYKATHKQLSCGVLLGASVGLLSCSVHGEWVLLVKFGVGGVGDIAKTVHVVLIV